MTSNPSYFRPMAGYAKNYKLPDRELAAILNLGMTYEDARTRHDGYFSSWIERARTVRDGRPVITLQERGQGWAVEVTLDTSGNVAKAAALSAERAGELEEQQSFDPSGNVVVKE